MLPIKIHFHIFRYSASGVGGGARQEYKRHSLLLNNKVNGVKMGEVVAGGVNSLKITHFTILPRFILNKASHSAAGSFKALFILYLSKGRI